MDEFPDRDWDGLEIHFVAIGGVGMSALARIAAGRGADVTGCDRAESGALAALRGAGIPCRLGHSPDHLDGADLVVYSSAVPPETPELQAARRRDIPLVSRGRMLAVLQRGFDTVDVAGAHGKTTTTWIIANLLIRCGADPTVAVGGTVSDLGGNWRSGRGRLFVAESDESDGSFLHLAATYPVVTNIDADHLDYWPDVGAIEAAFARFASAGEGGAVLACADCPRVATMLDVVDRRTITYGLEAGDVRAENVRLRPTRAVYDARLPGGVVKDVVLSLPGRHNVQNSLAALALAVELDLPMDAVLEALADTSAVDRRLQLRGRANGVAVYDDYAHHPAEIRATLDAARLLTDRRLVGVFQPHRYSRTQRMHREFGPVFGKLDRLIVGPIYAAWEPAVDGVDARLIADAVAAHGDVDCELVDDFAGLPERLAPELEAGDVVLTLGAGDVWQTGDALLRLIEEAAEGDVPNAAGE
ncbi:MAG: UDP-N-acetylmuramate--L-alanine ligase [Planctomycetota bacterium]